MNNHCIICGVEIPEGRQVCPFCRDEKMTQVGLDSLMDLLETDRDIRLVFLYVKDELIGLTIPPETLLSLLKDENDFIRYYIFGGPIKSVEYDDYDTLVIKL